MANAADFVFDAPLINECIKNLKIANSKVDSSYKKASEALANIKNNEDMWSGESNLAMQEFMDLCLQYHKKFIGDANSDNPISQAIGTLTDAYNGSCSFYDDSSAYLDLKKI